MSSAIAPIPQSKHLRTLIAEAVELGIRYECGIKSPILLMALYQNNQSEASAILHSMLNPSSIRYSFLDIWGLTPEGPARSRSSSDNVREANPEPLLARAASLAEQYQSAAITPSHLALAMLDDKKLAFTLRHAGLDKEEIESYRAHLLRSINAEEADQADVQAPHSELFAASTMLALAAPVKPKTNWRPLSLSSDSALGKCIDITLLALEGKLPPVIGRSDEIARTTRILGRMVKGNPLLVGPEGVGKTAIIEGLAMAIVTGNVPAGLRNKRIMQVDISDAVAGSQLRGSFEEKFKAIINEAQTRSDIILFIDELHTIIGAGKVSGGSLDAGNMLKPALARGTLRCIGATTTEEYRTEFEKDRALRRRFPKVVVNPPSVAETIQILQGLQANLEKHHFVSISPEALTQAAVLADRYINERFLPDKAIDLIDEACSAVAGINAADSAEAPLVTGEDVAVVVNGWTGIPVESLTKTDREKLLNLEDRLRYRVIGQDPALEEIADAVRRARSGLSDPNRPIGSFLFTGPTGVGKTEAARALQDVLFDNGDLVRFDMSEYMEQHSVARLIGPPPGYVGYDKSGLLTEAIRNKPYAVLLLDELEKAHSDVFNLLLQVLDAGQLTDSHGIVVDFRNVVIIATTNTGARERKQRSIGFAAENAGETAKVDEALKRSFRPEFLNRFDAIVHFNDLSQEVLRQIVDIQISHVRQRLAVQGMELAITDAAKDYLAVLGWDAEYGARPLKRAIDKNVNTPLSRSILKDELRSGMTVLIDAPEEQLSFSFSTTESKAETQVMETVSV